MLEIFLQVSKYKQISTSHLCSVLVLQLSGCGMVWGAVLLRWDDNGGIQLGFSRHVAYIQSPAGKPYHTKFKSRYWCYRSWIFSVTVLGTDVCLIINSGWHSFFLVIFAFVLLSAAFAGEPHGCCDGWQVLKCHASKSIYTRNAAFWSYFHCKIKWIGYLPL